MSERLREFLDGAAGEALPDGLEEWDDSYALVPIDGEALLMRVRDGSMRVEPMGTDASAECVISADEETLVRLLQGGINASTAWMRGDIEVEGDLPAAARLNNYIRSRKGSVALGVSA